MNVYNLAQLREDVGYEHLTLEDIHQRIQAIFRRVPPIPASRFRLPDDEAESVRAPNRENPQYASQGLNKQELHRWASSIHAIIDDYALLLSCIGPATYAWGLDASSAAEQQLGLLTIEVGLSQTQIDSQIKPRIKRVVAPPEVILKETVVRQRNDNGSTTDSIQYRAVVDNPTCVAQSHADLARNADMLRQVLLANLDRMLRALHDFISNRQVNAD